MPGAVLIRCAPNGARAGFLAVTARDRSLSVTVLPKMWSLSWKPVERSVRPSDVHVVAHEGDVLKFDLADGGVATALLESAAAAAKEWAERRSAAAATYGGRGRRDQRPPAPILRRDEGVWEDDGEESLTRGAGDGGGAPLTGADQPFDSDGITALLALALLCEKLQQRSQHETLDHVYAEGGSAGPSGMEAGERENPVLALLRAWEFVAFVEAHVREVRQGYQEVDDALWSPRGRFLTAGLIRAEALEEPRMLCRYDIFTPSTPLFRLVVSALERLVGGSPFHDTLKHTELARRIRERSSRLRKALAYIPSAPAIQAVTEARHVRLGRLLAAWAPARTQAIAILERRDAEAVSRPGASDAALVWSVDMSKVWERLLADSVRSIAGSVATPGHPDGLEALCPSPWREVGNDKLPDMVAHYREQAWVLDAKYKRSVWKGGRPVLSPEDQYQLFSYSHTVAVGLNGTEISPERVAIIRPRRSTEPPGPRTPFPRQGSGPDCWLQVVDVPFPEPDIILSQTNLLGAEDAIGVELQACLFNLTSPPSTPSSPHSHPPPPPSPAPAATDTVPPPATSPTPPSAPLDPPLPPAEPHEPPTASSPSRPAE